MFTLRVETPNLDKTIKSLNLNDKAVANAVKKSIRKGTKDAPKLVVNAITAVYGSLVGGIQLLYEGRRLTPTHFKMRWKQKEDGRYDIRATFIKGHRKKLSDKKYGTPLFMAPQQTGVMLPWQRKGKKRLPVYAIKTIGIPQMVENETVRADYEPKIDAMITKIVQENVDAILPKSQTLGADAG